MLPAKSKRLHFIFLITIAPHWSRCGALINLNNMENIKHEMKRSIRRQQETNHLKNRL
jgi:hypothetical protein